MDEAFDFSQELEYPNTARDFSSFGAFQENANDQHHQETLYQTASPTDNLILNQTTGWQEDPPPGSSAHYPRQAEPYYQEDYDAEEEEAQQKPMADFASQRFKRTKKPAERSGAKKKRRELINANADDEEEIEEEVDEADQAEADEFYSQLIPETTDNLEMDNDDRRPLCRKRPRWHPQEAIFFRQCAALFDCNYTMIHDFLPHRTVADLKKQYDKQRNLYASLYASFGSTPRFHTLQEYHLRKAQLQEDKQKLDDSMRLLGVRPWAEPRKKKRKEDEDEDVQAEEESFDQEEEVIIPDDH